MTGERIHLAPAASANAQVNLLYGLFPEAIESTAHDGTVNYSGIDKSIIQRGVTLNDSDSRGIISYNLKRLESRTGELIEDWDRVRSDLTHNFPTEGEYSRFWASRRNSLPANGIQPGDWILFYTGDKRYRVAGKVADKPIDFLNDASDPAFDNHIAQEAIRWPSEYTEFWSSDPEQGLNNSSEGSFNDRWAQFVERSEPEFPVIIPIQRCGLVDVDGRILQGLLRRKRAYVQSFTALTDEQMDTLVSSISAGDAILEFLTQTNKKRAKELGSKFSPQIRRSLNQTYGLSLDPAITDRLESMEDPFALQKTAESIFPLQNASKILDRFLLAKNILLVGPPLTGKTQFFEMVENLWNQIHNEATLEQRQRFLRSSLPAESLLATTDDGLSPASEFARLVRRAGVESTHEEQGTGDLTPQYLSWFEANDVDALPPLLTTNSSILARTQRGRENLTRIDQFPFWVPNNLHIGAVIHTSPGSVDIPPQTQRVFSVIETSPNPTHAMRVLLEDPSATPQGASTQLEQLVEDGDNEVQQKIALSIGAIHYINECIAEEITIGYHALSQLETGSVHVEPLDFDDSSGSADKQFRELIARWREMIIPELRLQVDMLSFSETDADLNDIGLRQRLSSEEILQLIDNAGSEGIDELT